MIKLLLSLLVLINLVGCQRVSTSVEAYSNLDDGVVGSKVFVAPTKR